MNSWTHPEWLVGQRYVADFTVVAIEPEGPAGWSERKVTLTMFGDRYHLTLGELHLLIESGLVTEARRIG